MEAASIRRDRSDRSRNPCPPVLAVGPGNESKLPPRYSYDVDYSKRRMDGMKAR